MLDGAFTQAAGLMGLAPQEGPRMMSLVSHGDERAELPLLWQLCWALSDSGYTVTVLDATTMETDEKPGLNHLLDHRCWQPSDNPYAPSWTIIPSAHGIHSLAHQELYRLETLGELFSHEGIVVLYGKAELLVPLLSGTGASPLLALTASKASLLTSYLALKRLLVHGRMAPTVVNVMQNGEGSIEAASRAAMSLGDCAKHFLDYEVHALNIANPAEEERCNETMRRLALRMLETAVPLTPTAPRAPHFVNHGTFAGAH
jgi:hypothetical protein